MTVDQALDKLHRSKFRSGFHLTKAEKAYLEEKGMDVIRRAVQSIEKPRL